VNAGHIAPVLYRKATGKYEDGISRQQSGFPLGVAEGIPYEACTVSLAPGDSVLMISDGVTEAKNRQEKEFQMDGVYAALKAGPSNPKAIGERLVTQLKQHFTGCKQHDDITVVCFGRV
jgi:sigma-B regulation protein RsbU (phosphoserine phosphatase)